MIDIENLLKNELIRVLKTFNVNDETLVVLERSKVKDHGDYATNLAMRLTKILGMKPFDIAKKIIEEIKLDLISKTEIAGPGFINFFVKTDSLKEVIMHIINDGKNYGDSSEGKNELINVEFVSANPTGDLHLGHARGAALGDSIARLYKKAGYNVTKEYYINDAGNQIDNLGHSLKARYLQECGIKADLPEQGYHAQDIIEIAKSLVCKYGTTLTDNTEENFQLFISKGKEFELEKIKRDLLSFRVTFDVYSSETAIRKTGKVEKVLSDLDKYIYVSENASFLKTTEFGDDKDRVIIKNDGSYTYLLPDIAYHLDKLNRKHTKLIDLLGADHHGYVARMKAALCMEGYSLDTLEVEMVQMVRLFKDGNEYKMSKRTGNAVSLRELIEDVGVDSARYFFVSRAGSSHLDFDLDLAKTMSSANPVYYAQYAHARLATVLELCKEYEIDYSGELLNTESEKDLLKSLSEFGSEVVNAALTRSPYKVTIYIQKLATQVNNFYTNCRINDPGDVKMTSCRLGLVAAAKLVLENALDLIGVSAPNHM